MNYQYICPDNKKVRVIISTDAKNEADDQYAIVHALLTPKFNVKGIVASHFGNFHSEHSMLDSYKECIKITEIMNSNVNVYKGAVKRMQTSSLYEFSEGAECIVKKALTDDETPLFVLCMGPVTDIACALLKCPEIEEKVTVIWNGGEKYPDGGFEFNLSNDILAANIIMSSKMSVWQIPADVVTEIIVGIAELEKKVRPCGKIGYYLFQQLADFNVSPNAHWTSGETWGLGDSCTVGVLLHDNKYNYVIQEAPGFNDDMTYRHSTGYRKIRVYRHVDARMILEDFYSKLSLSYPKREY